jgi:tRNA nucleotidyltransferase/poly(A) polymerase
MNELALPTALQSIAQKLTVAGRTAILVGPALRDLLCGVEPDRIEVSTDAPLRELLGCFPEAVLIGVRRATVMIPRPPGCVDVTSLPASRAIERELAQRDFTINAIAYDIAQQKWLDPHGGRRDLACDLIRAVGSARDRLAEDPIRALRAIRLAATRGWQLDGELEVALASAAPALAAIAREPVRRELVKLLLAPGAALALERLQRSGIAQQIAPGSAPDAGELVERLPRDLGLRLAGWLRGARARAILQRLRFPREVVERVDLLLRGRDSLDSLDVMRPAAAARFARRIGAQGLAALIALRRAEPTRAASATESALLQRLDALLDELRDSERVASQRSRLAASGADVIAWLGCEPGPRVGRAIAYLTERIRLEPALNTPDGLRALLRDWLDPARDG